MILRRITQHVRDQNWTAIVIDFVIVVVGVFIGIQVSNWNASRVDMQDAAEYHRRLVDDVLSERDAVAARIDYYEDVRAYGVSALGSLQTPGAERDAAFLVDLYQATQEWQLNPARPTFDEMVSAGRIRLIPDPGLRNRLAVYYSQLGEYMQSWTLRTTYRETVRAVLPLDLQRRIHETCEEVVLDDSGGSVVAPAEGACVVRISADELAAGIEAVLAVDDLPVMLTRQLSVIDEKLRMFADRQDQADAMLSYLRSAQ